MVKSNSRKSNTGIKKYIKFEKMTPTVNMISILLGFIIICIIILQIRTPFITNTIDTLKEKINSYIFMKNEINNTKDEILEMEEDSLISVNNNNGGIDDVNGNITIDKALSDTMFNEVHDGMEGVLEGFQNKKERPRFMIQESVLGSKVITETFNNGNSNNNNASQQILLKLYYEPGCPHSEEFMSIWTQIKEVLPSNVETEEINYKNININGSIYQSYQVRPGKPTLLLVRPDVLKPEETIYITYRGSKDFLSIKQWLLSQDVKLEYNPELEHFDRTGGYVGVDEEFNNISSGIAGGAFGGGDLCGHPVDSGRPHSWSRWKRTTRRRPTANATCLRLCGPCGSRIDPRTSRRHWGYPVHLQE